jgi:hypothetical protein
LMIAAREVCPADASGEKDVAVEQDFVAGGVEAEASGTVARNQKNTKGRAAKIKVSCFVDQKVRVHRFRFEKEIPLFEEIRVCHQRDTIFVIADLASGGLLDLGGVIEMIGVTVRKDEQIESYSQIANPIRRPGGSIDQHISSWRLDEVRVRIENTANKGLKVEHSE